MSTQESAVTGNTDQSRRSVTIRVYGSTDYTPYVLREVPVSLTIADLRARLTQAIPSHPAPATQRLIFLGRRLVDDSMTIAEVIGGLAGDTFTFHLLLPMETNTAATSSIAHASTGVPQISVSPATSVNPGPQRPYPVGEDQRQQSIEVARRRIEALNRQLNELPTGTEDINEFRRRVPAWQTAHSRPIAGPVTGSAQTDCAADPSVTATGLTVTPWPTSTTGRSGLSAQVTRSAVELANVTRREYSVLDPNGREYLLIEGQYNAAPAAAAASAAANVRPATQAAEGPVRVGPGADNGIQQLLAEAATRRLWLFARLWLMSYLLSPWGAWARVLFVFVSALASVLFEYQRPRWLWESVIRPIRRHIEDLAHVGGPRQAAGGQNNGENRGDRRGRSELWETLRRAERAIVLLLASLIPGVGERQVETRNAAEAERGRQEGQERARADDGSAADGAEQAQVQQVAPERE